MDYEHRAVAFLDILGWGRAVDNSATDPELRRRLLNATWALAARVQDYVETDTPDHPSRDEYSQFSDSLVISFPYEAPCDLLRLLRLVTEFQTTMLMSGFPLRGGVTVGPLFHSREIVFGPAMNQAYALESKIAVHPRVVIDPALEQPLLIAKATLPNHWPFIVSADGGLYETDFLTILARSPAISKVIDDNIDGWIVEHRTNSDVLAKYQWLKVRWEATKNTSHCGRYEDGFCRG